MTEKWDDIFSAAKAQPIIAEVQQASVPHQEIQKKESKLSRSVKTRPVDTPWSDLTPEEKEATVRLNVDIPVSLNDLLAEKARKLRKPKTELVRRLLQWALTESNK